MDQAELEIAAKMIGGVAYEGALYVPEEKEPSQCEGCGHLREDFCCKEFLRKAEQLYGIRCQNIIWIKQNLK